MTSVEPEATASPPPSPRFQFTLRTLLLFVVAALSLAVFGAGGIIVFVLTLALAIFLREAESLPSLVNLLAYLLLALICLGWLIALLTPAVQIHREWVAMQYARQPEANGPGVSFDYGTRRRVAFLRRTRRTVVASRCIAGGRVSCPIWNTLNCYKLRFYQTVGARRTKTPPART